MHDLSRSFAPWTFDERIELLNTLERLQMENRDAICAAIKEDYGGTRTEGWNKLADVFLGLNTLRHVKANLAKWMQGQSVDVGFPFALQGKGRYTYEPLGVVLIITPWNYPWHLAMSGLADALGAGNRVIIKPSEFTPHTAKLMQDLIAKYFPTQMVTVMTGGADVASHLCSLPFDHIMYTGSPRVGKIIAKAAAANLTPCTLELGGKCPVIAAPDADISSVATLVLNSKIQTNSGQTCIAPDYVLVPNGKGKEFAEEAVKAIRNDWGRLANKEGYCGIISENHYDRLMHLAQDAKNKGATVFEVDEAPQEFDTAKSLRFPPKVIVNITDDMDIASEEIFGPLLGVLEYEDMDQAIKYINERPRPLALYVFSNDAKVSEKVIHRTVSGGVTVNGIGTHCLPQALPFGGVGNSGYGSYHGEEGFRTFSHKKPIFESKKIVVKPPNRGPQDYDKQAEFLIKFDPGYYFETGKAILKVTGAMAALAFGAKYFRCSL